jgi:YcaO-like protein with predicted kinase domain
MSKTGGRKRPLGDHELERQHSVECLREGLSRTEPIIYSVNGNRSRRGEVFLKHLEKLLPDLGITRIADISYLSPSNYPVFQSCRPNYLLHSYFGQNSGSQGKGPTRTQAKISCIMETLEGYCAEPRSPDLIRGTYAFLKQHHAAADPREFLRCTVDDGTIIAPVEPTETLLWTPAYSVETDETVLIPAECVYFPFVTSLFNCRRIYPSTTNGLAAGATYLEAAIHGLYEVIERHYLASLHEGTLKLEALLGAELENVGVAETALSMAGELELQLYTLELPAIRNLPVIMCVLAGDETACLGYGCSSTIKISLDRAISEALQSYATRISGTREDMLEGGDGVPRVTWIFAGTPQPRNRTLRLKDYRRRVHDKRFASLKQEFDFVVDWVHRLGCKKIFIANLTRGGVDVPTVKVVTPTLGLVPTMRSIRTATPSSYEATLARIFPLLP